MHRTESRVIMLVMFGRYSAPCAAYVAGEVAEILGKRGNPSVSCARDAVPARRLGDRA